MRMAATAVRQRTRDVVEAGGDSGDREFLFTGRDFEQVRRLIRERAGIALAEGKQDMVYGRLSRRLRTLTPASRARSPIRTVIPAERTKLARSDTRLRFLAGRLEPYKSNPTVADFFDAYGSATVPPPRQPE